MYIIYGSAYTVISRWSDQLCINHKERTIWNRIENHIQQLKKVQNILVQMVIPIWKTIEVKRMQTEKAISPIKYILNHFCKLVFLWLNKLYSSNSPFWTIVQAWTTIRLTRWEELPKLCSQFTHYINPIRHLETCEIHLFGGQKGVLLPQKITKIRLKM